MVTNMSNIVSETALIRPKYLQRCPAKYQWIVKISGDYQMSCPKMVLMRPNAFILPY